MPLNIKGNQSTDIAQTNRWALQIEAQLADLQKKAKDVPNVAAKVASAQSSSGKITLTAPPEITVVGSPAPLGGEFDLDWTDEPQQTVFGVPAATYQAVGADNATANTVAGNSISVTANPTLTGDYGLFFGFGSGTGGPGVATVPSGFTSLDTSTGLSGKILSGTDPLTASATVPITGSNQFVSGALVLVQTGGGTPAIIQSAATSGAFTGGTVATVTFAGSVTAGNSILVLIEASASTYGAFDFPYSSTVSDNKTNVYQRLVGTGGGGGAAGVFTVNQGFAWLARANSSGSTTVSVAISGSASQILAGVAIKVYELTNITTATSEHPRFIDPFTTMGPIDLGLVGTGGGISGVLPLTHGGTAADLSSTGGTNKVLLQTALGSPISVGQLDYNNLLGTTKATRYNTATLTGVGLVNEVGELNLVNQSANVVSTTMGAVPAAGLYRITFYLIVTTAATTSSTLPSFVLDYTDQDNSTAQTLTFVPTTPTGNSLTTQLSGTCIVNVANLAQPLVSTTGYASSGGTSMKFALRAKLEAI
jgi:hypothetical protein